MGTTTLFPVKVGLVGLGVLSQRALLPHFALPDAKEKIDLVAVCDVDAERARLTAKTYSVPEYYTSLDDMLRAAPIDGVLICTPIQVHHANAMAALRAGKHVYVQKTVATNLKDAQEIFAEARRHDLVAVASPEQMLNPARQAARQLIAEDAIGQVYWALCATNAPGHQIERARLGEGPLNCIDPSWYFKAGAGPVFDMTVYSLHAITGLLGPVRQVTALSGRRVPLRRWKEQEIAVEMDDNTLLLLDLGEGVFAFASGSTAFAGRSVGWGDLSIFGAKGALEIYSENPSEPNLASVVEVVGGETYRFADFGPYLPPEHAQMSDPHVYADIMHFVECVASRTHPHTYAAQACHVVEVIEKGYLAARSGRVQSIETMFEL